MAEFPVVDLSGDAEDRLLLGDKVVQGRLSPSARRCLIEGLKGRSDISIALGQGLRLSITEGGTCVTLTQEEET